MHIDTDLGLLQPGVHACMHACIHGQLHLVSVRHAYYVYTYAHSYTHTRECTNVRNACIHYAHVCRQPDTRARTNALCSDMRTNMHVIHKHIHSNISTNNVNMNSCTCTLHIRMHTCACKHVSMCIHLNILTHARLYAPVCTQYSPTHPNVYSFVPVLVPL